MLHLFLKYPVGFMGIIGYFFNELPLPVGLALIFVYVFIPYLLGSINTAIIVSSTMYHDDIRKHGSGNAGFTNMMRTYGKKAAAITFAGDIGKTVLAIMVGWCVYGYLSAFIAGFACFIGHIFPVFYQFKGGKGVLCLATLVLMMDWRIFLMLLVLFVGIVWATKYISAGSVICAMVFPIVLNRINDTPWKSIELIAVLIAVIVVVKHRANLKRIFDGTESKFTFKVKSKARVTESDNTTGNSGEDSANG